MEWAALAGWIAAAAISLPLGVLAPKGAPVLSLQTAVAVSGLVLWIIAMAIGGSNALGWIVFALGILGLAVMATSVGRQHATAGGPPVGAHAEAGTSTQLAVFAVATVLTLLATVSVGLVSTSF